MEIKAPIFAIVTPFTESNEIDYGALSKYLTFLQDKGVEAIITNGTTAEFCSLTLKERKGVVEFCRKNFSGQILNHVGASSLLDSIELLKHSERYCDGVLSLPPYYFANAPEEGVYHFFKELLLHTNLPFYIYNFPRHTQFTVSERLIVDLKREFSHLVGIKDSSGDLELSQLYLGTGLDVFVGKDSAAYDVLAKGMSGNVSGAGNPVPEFLVNLTSAFHRNEIEKAEQIKKAYEVWNKFRKSLHKTEVAVVKAAIADRVKGFPIHVRPPFVECNPTELEQIKTKLNSEILDLINQINR